MRKSMWLLSAGSIRAFHACIRAGNRYRAAATADAGATPAAESPTEAASTEADEGDVIVVTAQGRSADPAGRSDRGHRGQRRIDAEFSGATDIRAAEPARAVAARFLDQHRSQWFGPYPRHRHGRRQPRPRKLGRGVHRRRLSLALGHRPQRAWRDRPGRGAARAARHPVRPQRLGRPDPHLLQEAVVQFRRLWRSDDRQL